MKPWDIRMAWTAFTSEAAISGSTGVYEIADAEGGTLYLGAATARDLFGLRGRIAAHFSPSAWLRTGGGRAAFYRYEVTTAYLSRHAELLGRYHEEHGGLPPENEPVASLPRFGNVKPQISQMT